MIVQETKSFIICDNSCPVFIIYIRILYKTTVYLFCFSVNKNIINFDKISIIKKQLDL